MAATLPRRLLVAGVTVLGVGAASVVTALPAQAASWDTVLSVHKSRTQVCKEPAGNGFQLRLRLDNRNADHAHLPGSRATATETGVRARAGEVSKVKTLFVQRSDDLVIGMGEITGEGLGDSLDIRQVGAC